ncbi:MAG: trypsin-like peptidase domain-containing protein [Planctomycetaceae bacterium]|nr:trypsin-like peptidase domain-containing protein [Planctomycetaceae bacterium]
MATRSVGYGFLPAVILMLISATVSADVIVLRTGQRIEGQVLKVQPDALFVDIGVDVIRIPMDRIAERKTDEESPAEPALVETESGLLRSAKLPVRTVKELVSRFGEGVVLIQNPEGLGSGFLISDSGHCVTNYHVVEGQTRIAATIFHQGDMGDFERIAIRDVKILALNPHFDLALLQIPEQKGLKFKPVYIAEDDSHREGDMVFAIGSPLGLERSVSEGIVSTRNRNMDGIVYIQTTAQINPGNSGGPLFNSRGEVVGVINMKLTFGEGLGFAIPVAYLRHFINNRDAFAFDKTNPNTGYHYLTPPRRRNPEPPPEPEAAKQ